MKFPSCTQQAHDVVLTSMQRYDIASTSKRRHTPAGKYSRPIIPKLLTLKAPITTAADDSLEYLFIVFFSVKIRLDISCESSAGQQRIHTKHQALFFSKDKSRKIKVSSAAMLLGSLKMVAHPLKLDLSCFS